MPTLVSYGNQSLFNFLPLKLIFDERAEIWIWIQCGECFLRDADPNFSRGRVVYGLQLPIAGKNPGDANERRGHIYL
jgi:hypothetical protein